MSFIVVKNEVFRDVLHNSEVNAAKDCFLSWRIFVFVGFVAAVLNAFLNAAGQDFVGFGFHWLFFELF